MNNNNSSLCKLFTFVEANRPKMKLYISKRTRELQPATFQSSAGEGGLNSFSYNHFGCIIYTKHLSNIDDYECERESDSELLLKSWKEDCRKFDINSNRMEGKM